MNFFRRLFKLSEKQISDNSVFELIESAKPKYLNTLKNIETILRQSELSGQANFVENVILKLASNDYEIFRAQMNSVEMWGGSGAVWEVYIENNEMQRKFQMAIIELINLMEQTKILGRGIRPLRNLFQKELRRSV